MTTLTTGGSPWERWDRAVVAITERDRPGELRRLEGALAGLSVLRPGATEEQVGDLEWRLGVRLPGSYRRFLLSSNGSWAAPWYGLVDTGMDDGVPGLLDAGHVGWVRDMDRTLTSIWFNEFDSPLDEADYLSYAGEALDPVHTKHGHIRWCLQVSGGRDGWTVLLNPLVIDGDGEWEAWDFGSKNPGAVRYPSFGALIDADSSRIEADLASPHEPPPPRDRIDELVRMARTDEAEARRGLAELASDGAAPLPARQRALGALARLATGAVPELQPFATDPEPRLQGACLGRLATSPDRTDRNVAMTALTERDLEGFVLRGLPLAAADAIHAAWLRSGRPELLVQLARLGDPRAGPPLAAALLSPDTPPAAHDELVQYAWWPRDRTVVPALLELARRTDAPLADIGVALSRLGATSEAIPVLADAIRSHRDPGHAATELGGLSDPAAGEALLDAVPGHPTANQIMAVGQHPSPSAVALLLDAVADPGLQHAAMAAAELMGPIAADVAAELARTGSLDAVRALARMGDERALEPLLSAIAEDDVDTARAGADGLRDLRHEHATAALEGAVHHPDRRGVAVIACHGLVMKRASSAPDACAALAADADPDVARLGARWRAQLGREAD